LIEVRDTSVPIVILQSVPSLQHGGLGVARTAGRLGVQVYWIHGRGRAPATLSRYVRGTFCWDTRAPVEASVAYLQECSCKIEGSKPILIPVDDAAAIFVADQADALREHFLFPDQPAGQARTLSSKKEMHFLCKKTGVSTPEAAFPQSLADVATFAESAVFAS
jgi:D-aspartate ligase